MPEILHPSFAKGEVSPELYGRVDTAMYQVALRKAHNVLIHSEGGLSNRPGLLYSAPVKTHTEAPRVIKFQFNTTDTYCLIFGNQYMRVIREDGGVLNASTAISGVTQANPAVVSASGHSAVNGSDVFISGVVGMDELNGGYYRAAGVSSGSLQLTHQVTGANINSSAFSAYSSGGTVSVVFELATPYVIADVFDLVFKQSADVITITHPSYEIRELARSDHNSWALTSPTFGPTQDHPTGQTVTVNTTGSETRSYQVTAIALDTFEESLPALGNTTATVTGVTQANPAVVTTSSTHGYATGDEVEINSVVGMVEINQRRFEITVLSGTTFSLSDENSTGYVAYSSGGTSNETSVGVANSASSEDNTIAWTAVAGALKYSVYRRDNGIYGLLGETETTTFLDSNLTPDLDLNPPKQRNPFLGTGNYPSCSGYHAQRRVFGGWNNSPNTTEHSVTGQRSNFSKSPTSRATDAITATLVSDEVHVIRQMLTLNDLILFTSEGVWRVFSGADSGFEASTIKQKPQSLWGSSVRQPIAVGDTALYVQENNAVVRALSYSLTADAYSSTDMNLLSSHLFETHQIVDWTYCKYPDPRIYAVRSDGTAACLTFYKDQEVIAWTTLDTDGHFESVTALRPSSSFIEDTPYFVVKRTINGQTVRNVERFQTRIFDDVRDAKFLDCGISYDDPKTITNTTAASPVVVTSAAHGFSNGDEVDISDVVWASTFDDIFNEVQPEQLNNTRFTVASSTTNTFALNDSSGVAINGTAFSAYVSGGKVRRAVNSIKGLQHLAGHAVIALADGGVVSALTVASDGSLTMDRKYSRIHVGLRFISDVETLDFDQTQNPITGKMLTVSDVTMRFMDSRGLLIGPNFDSLVEMKQREYEDWGEPTNMLTGKKRITLDPEWDDNGRVAVRQKDPLPMTILGITADTDVGDY